MGQVSPFYRCGHRVSESSCGWPKVNGRDNGRVRSSHSQSSIIPLNQDWKKLCERITNGPTYVPASFNFSQFCGKCQITDFRKGARMMWEVCGRSSRMKGRDIQADGMAEGEESLVDGRCSILRSECARHRFAWRSNGNYVLNGRPRWWRPWMPAKEFIWKKVKKHWKLWVGERCHKDYFLWGLI